MPDITEIQVQLADKKKVVKNPDKESDETFKYKFEAVNSDAIDSFKIKSSKDFAIEEDTFSFRALATQKNLEEIVDDQTESEE